jgi:CBS domain-containing protein
MLAKNFMETNVITLKKGVSIKEIAELMIQKGISGFPVVDDDNRVIGVVSELDLMRKEIKPNEPNVWQICARGIQKSQNMQDYVDATRKYMAEKAEDIMTSPAITVDESDSLETAGRYMFEKKIKRVFVTREGKLVGVISRNAFTKLLLEQLKDK